jgi:hypothetical protein
MAGLVNVKRWIPLIAKHNDECAHQYINRWRELLPSANINSLYNAYSFMAVTMLYVCSYTDRFRKWKKKHSSQRVEIKATTEDLIRFVHAGFMSLVRNG